MDAPERIYTVYIHIVPKALSGNECDKYYVGVTRNNVKKRWLNGNGYCKNKHFWRAITKYGWGNIEHDIVAEHLTADEASDMEKALIKALKSNDYRYGYNKNGGGIDGVEVSDETRALISKHHADVSGLNNPGIKHIYQFTVDGTYVNDYFSIVEAAKQTGFDRHSISVASVHNRIAGGYLWIPESNVTKVDGIHTIKEYKYKGRAKSNGRREIHQFNIDGEFINKYPSIKDASNETGLSVYIISDSARKKKTKTGLKNNYLWRYKEDVIESPYGGSFLMIS